MYLVFSLFYVVRWIVVVEDLVTTCARPLQIMPAVGRGNYLVVVLLYLLELHHPVMVDLLFPNLKISDLL